MTLLQVIHAILDAFSALGAHHPYTLHHASDGLVATRHYLVVVCKIPGGYHGVYHCSGQVSR